MSSVRRSWDRFWFTPYSVAPLILIRAVFGLLVFLWALSVLPDAKSFFGPEGVLNAPPHRAGAWSLFDIWDGDAAAVTSIVVVGTRPCFLRRVSVRAWHRLWSSRFCFTPGPQPVRR